MAASVVSTAAEPPPPEQRSGNITVMVSVRRATPADVEFVRAVGFGTWPATYGPLLGDEYVQRGLATWWASDRVLRGITDNTTYLAQVDDNIVGTAVVGRLDGTPMLWKLYVLPAHQKTGAGRALLDAVIAGLDEGADRLWLDHAEGNDNAHGFYERHGFQELFRHQAEDGDREVRMERRLR